MRRAATVSGMVVVILLGIFLGQARGYLAQEGASEDITNDRVIQMAKMGLDDDIIIAKIKTSHTKFALADEDLVALKKAGVSAKVIAAMLESNVLTNARVKVDGNLVELHTLGQTKTGGRLGSDLTFHIKSVKEKAYLQGQHAAVISSTKPKIEVELPPSDTIDSYILVKMNGKGDRRELEVGSVGTAVGAKQGVRAEDVVKTSAESLGGRRYMMTTQNPLKSGEYILYVVGSADFTKGIFGKGYDFTVE
ncbi:MAG TPA: hypothetical protein VGW33_13635 [Terriglobia bacterium]|nr:hypothetical protein [Terriglobia bacterium]